MINLLMSCLSFAVVNASSINVEGSGQYADYSRNIVCKSGFNIPFYQRLILQNSPNPDIYYAAEGYFVGDLEMSVSLAYDVYSGSLSYSFEITDFAISNLHYYLDLNANGDYVDVPLSSTSLTLDIDLDRNHFLYYDTQSVSDFSNLFFDIPIYRSDSLGICPVFRVGYLDGNNKITLAYDSPFHSYIDPNDTLTYNDGKVFSNTFPLGGGVYNLYGFSQNNIRTFENSMVLDTSGYNYSIGYDEGFDYGYGVGYSKGRADGFQEGFNADSTAVTIFNGILSIGMLPINVFLAMLNFDILGINVANFVSALLSVCITLIVVRVILGTNKGD